jgi:RNA polymerase sigma-70 factor (ECF subfamily)
MPAELRRDAASERVRALYEEHATTLLRHARRRAPQLAEDAVSETFAVAVRRAAEIPEGRELPWLYVVLDLTMRNLMRGQRRAGRVAEALLPLTPHASPPVEPPVVGGALGDLPDRERLMLTMTAFEGLSANEAAERIGIPYGSARNALVSGRRRLAVSLAAFGAAMLLVLVVRPWLSGPSSSERAPGILRASITESGAIHDVALIHRAGSAAPGTAARYERWSDPTGTRQRVVLPNGRELRTRSGESLLAAAGRVDRVTDGTPISAKSREDLAALDAASPSAIAGLASDVSADRSGTRGPVIEGHATTMLRGRVTAADGEQHAVEASIADDGPDLLRVRAQKLEAGQRVGASSIVEFVQWNPVPPGPAADAGLGASSAAVAPTTPSAGSTTSSAKSHASRSAPVPTEHDNPPAGTKEKLQPTFASAKPDGAESTASAPILHISQNVRTCMNSDGTNCRDDGQSDVYLELGGQGRTREVRHRDNQLLSEEWRKSTAVAYYRTSHNTGITRGSETTVLPGSTFGTLYDWHGAWFKQLNPELLRVRSASVLAALPAGPLVNGRPSVVSTVILPATLDHQADATVELRLDPSTGDPMEIYVHRDYPSLNGGPPMTGERFMLEIQAIERIPAGDHASLLRSRFPASAIVSHHR